MQTKNLNLDQPLLKDTKGAAKFLCTTPGALRVRVHRREISFRKISRRLYFYVPDLIKWIESLPGACVDEVI